MKLVQNEAVHLLVYLFEFILARLEVSEKIDALVHGDEARDLTRQELVQHLRVLAIVTLLYFAPGLKIFVSKDAQVALPFYDLRKEPLLQLWISILEHSAVHQFVVNGHDRLQKQFSNRDLLEQRLKTDFHPDSH